MKPIRSIIARILVALGLIIVVTGCKPHEERVMDRLERLSEDIQKHGQSWDADQWMDALEDLEDIHYDMEDCDFTQEQLTELGRVEGRLTVIIMTEGAKKLGDELLTFMEGAGAFMKGYREGAESMQDYSQEELQDYVPRINQQVEEIQNILDVEGN